MAIAAALAEYLTGVAFFLVGVVALRGWLHDRDRGRLWVAIATGCLGIIGLVSTLNQNTNFRYRVLTDVVVVALAGSGFAFMEFRNTLLPLGSRFRRTFRAVEIMTVAIVLLARIPSSPTHHYSPFQRTALLLLLGVWTMCVAEPAVRFFTIAAARPTLERARLRMVAGGYLGVVLLVLIGVFLRSAVRPGLSIGVQMTGVLLVPLISAFFEPPRVLRNELIRREAARERERLLLTLPAIVWTTDVNMRITSSHGAALSPIGAVPNEFVGRTLREFYDSMGAGDAPFAHLAYEMHQRVFAGESVTYDNTLGELVYENHIEPLHGPDGRVAGAVGLAVDVTEARRAHDRLLEAQSMANIGSWHWDVPRDAVTWSEELFNIHGLEPGSLDVTYALYLSHVHQDDRAFVDGVVRNAFTTLEPFQVSYRIVRPDGDVRVIASRGRVTAGPDGQTIAMSGTCQDVTEQKRAEQTLHDALEREREAARHLKALDEMKNAFLTAVSHELRTPLTAVLGFAKTLEAAGLPAGQQRHIIERLTASAEKLDGLLTDLLDLDRLSRGILEPRRRAADVTALAQRVVDAWDGGRTRPVNVVGESVAARVDGAQVERIIENLLANAAKYTPERTAIWVRVVGTPASDDRREGVLIVVEDEGAGVPEHLKESIFEPFRQGDIHAHSPGVGIGLSLVARFAELHGGRAWVEDRLGGGAAFRVLLPGPPVPGPPVPGPPHGRPRDAAGVPRGPAWGPGDRGRNSGDGTETDNAPAAPQVTRGIPGAPASTSFR